jgi:predicted Holliday junction resolvase-like endonuclease
VLLAALEANDLRLEVPKEIADLERKMRDDFRKANEVAKKAYYEEKAARQTREQEERLKRKRDDDALMEEVKNHATKKSKGVNGKVCRSSYHWQFAREVGF